VLKLHELNKYSVMTDDARFAGVWNMHALARLLECNCWFLPPALSGPLLGRKHAQHDGFCLELTVMLAIGLVEP